MVYSRLTLFVMIDKVSAGFAHRCLQLLRLHNIREVSHTMLWLRSAFLTGSSASFTTGTSTLTTESSSTISPGLDKHAPSSLKLDKIRLIFTSARLTEENCATDCARDRTKNHIFKDSQLIGFIFNKTFLKNRCKKPGVASPGSTQRLKSCHERLVQIKPI